MPLPNLVLVTGGAGFIGRHLTTRLLDDGYSVVVVDDGSTGQPALLDPRAVLIEADVRELSLRDLPDGVMFVVHLAARPGVAQSFRSPYDSNSINTEGTLRALELAARLRVLRFVFASSSSVYGGGTTPCPRSPYAAQKLYGEGLCRSWWEQYGLHTAALRFFNVFGPGQRHDSEYAALFPALAHAIREKRPFMLHGGGTQTRDFTPVTTVCAAVSMFLRSPRTGIDHGCVYDVGCGRSVPVREVAEHVYSIMETEPCFEESPRRAGDVLSSRADIGPLRAALTGWQPRTDMDFFYREYLRSENLTTPSGRLPTRIRSSR